MPPSPLVLAAALAAAGIRDFGEIHEHKPHGQNIPTIMWVAGRVAVPWWMLLWSAACLSTLAGHYTAPTGALRRLAGMRSLDCGFVGGAGGRGLAGGFAVLRGGGEDGEGKDLAQAEEAGGPPAGEENMLGPQAKPKTWARKRPMYRIR